MPMTATVTPHALHVASEDDEAHWTFDPGGRLVSGHLGERFFRVGLDGSVQQREGARGAPRRLPGAEAAGLLEQARAAALEASAGAEAGEAIARAVGWDAARYGQHAEAFGRVYRPIRVLPPDCYQAAVVQLTEGCSYGRCTFCTLYAGVPFRAKDRAALDEHLQAVAAFFGDALALRTRVFLGDANALLLPTDRLLSAMEAVERWLPGPLERGGCHTFVDAFTPPGKTLPELERLAAAGLRRVTVGLETAHRPLLRWLDKPGDPEDVAALVGRAKGAGLAVNVVVLIGAGGARFAAPHVEETAAFVRRLPLERGDTVYLSRLVVDPASRYAARAERDGVAPLDEAALAAQTNTLQASLREAGLRAAPYGLERWIY